MRLRWTKILPDAYQAMTGLENGISVSRLDPKLKELVKMRASQINGCAYCLDMHSKDALAIGEKDQRLHVLAAWHEAPFYTPQERAALAWCEALTLVPQSGAPDDVYQALEKVFTQEEIVELTMVIVTINAWNRLSVGFRTEAGTYVSRKGVV